MQIFINFSFENQIFENQKSNWLHFLSCKSFNNLSFIDFKDSILTKNKLTL